MKKVLMAALLFFNVLAVFAQAQNSWTNTFSIVIVKRSDPAVSTNSLSFAFAEGETASQTFQLSNNGNISAGFTVSSSLASSFKASWKPSEGWVPFSPNPDRSQFTWTGNQSQVLPLGFTFPYLDKTFTSISVKQDGTVLLDGANSLRPFQGANILTATNNVRYKKTTDRMVIAWEGAYTGNGNLTNLQFQAHLYKNGEIRYLYGNMDGATTGDATIGYQYNGSVSPTETEEDENVSIRDGSTGFGSGAMLTLTADNWITLSTTQGSVAKLSTLPLTVSVDASDRVAATQTGDITVNWSDGSQDVISLTVTLNAPSYSLDVLPATSVTFSGPAGFLSSTSVTLTNSGTGDLNYSFTDSSAQSTANYTWTNTTFNWRSSGGLFEFTPTTETSRDTGYTELIPIYPFPYFGTLYTNFSVNVDGFITLGSANGSASPQLIAPYRQDLIYDGNSRIYASGDRTLSVTWENMTGPDGPDQTFRLILKRDGTITFLYRNLDGTRWTGSSSGIQLKSSVGTLNENLVWSSRTGMGTVHTEEEITYTEVVDRDQVIQVPVTNTVTVFDDPLQNQAFSFVAANQPLLVYPVIGSLAPGETEQITIVADARKRSSGATAAYNILSEDPTSPTLNITFNISTNSPAALAMALDSDGDGQSDLNELLAGTDAQSADSTFRANVDGSRTITWTEPAGSGQINRTYTIWFTTNLQNDWEELAVVENQTSFDDTEHNGEPVIFYKVTVE